MTDLKQAAAAMKELYDGDALAERAGGGLNRVGEEVLRVSNELGMVTDLAHINDRAFYEVLERSSLPVTMTHTAAFVAELRGQTPDEFANLTTRNFFNLFKLADDDKPQEVESR